MLLAAPFLLFAAGKILKVVVIIAGVWKIGELAYQYYVLRGSAMIPLSSYNNGSR